METTPFIFPSELRYEDTDEANAKKLVFEPLMHGYGTTLGNSLRRVLLTSLTGAAVTSVKFEGASHEFTTIKGIKEDVVELSLNLKQLNLKVHTDEPVKLRLSKESEGVVTAGDIDANADVEIVNPEQVIATITEKNTEFTMELIVENGRGYIPVEERDGEELEVGWIKLDAMFSPIEAVAMNVEPVRIGDITNYDKLELTIETDNSITVEEAVEASSQILIEHLNLLLPGKMEEAAKENEEVIEVEEETKEDTKDTE